jgi:hypothetical protein
MNFILRYIKDARDDPWFYIVEPLLFLTTLGVAIYFFNSYITFTFTITIK